MGNPKATLEFIHDGRVARLTLRAPKANVLDARMIADLSEGVRQIRMRGDLAAILVTSQGPHFSFGASVEEHLPDRIRQALADLHGLLRGLLAAPAPTIAAVRGQCLGGGFELALACDLIVAEDTATLGCPEITLGVFPPAASALLPVRIGAARAAALTLIGETITGQEAAAAGLVARLVRAGSLDAVLDTWLTDSFLPRSTAGLRYAAAAVRATVRDRIEESLRTAERLYLDGLMIEPDAVEGIRAFLEKRRPRWTTPASV